MGHTKIEERRARRVPLRSDASHVLLSAGRSGHRTGEGGRVVVLGTGGRVDAVLVKGL